MSEWVNCVSCGTLMENLCACPRCENIAFGLALDELSLQMADPQIENGVCPSCGGEGWWAKWPGNGDPPEQEVCDRCNGTGLSMDSFDPII